MNTIDSTAIDWKKMDGLVPAIIQDADTGMVLMLGYMNPEALAATQHNGRVTFYSRSKQRLWTKGETSGHYLQVVSLHLDCDNDSILVTTRPVGPTCHTGSTSCFGDDPLTGAERFSFLSKLDAVIDSRIREKPEGSYTARIWEKGLTRMAQKVGEEGVEVALAAVAQDVERLSSESADLLFHLALLLKARQLTLAQVVEELAARHTHRTQ